MINESTLATEEARSRALYGTWCIKSGVVNVVAAAATDMQMPIRPVMPLNIELAAEVVIIVGSAIWTMIGSATVDPILKVVGFERRCQG